MEPWLIGLISFLIFIGLLLLGVPVACGLGVTGVGLVAISGTTGGLSYLLPSSALYNLASYALICLPLFILLSSFMEVGGMGDELFEFASRWLNRVPGSLAIASIFGSAGFAAISGSSVATAAAIGGVAIPEMKSRKYEPKLAYGAIAAGGTLGILIPPSINFINYGVLSGTDIGALFMAGVIPGIMIAVAFALYIGLVCKLRPSYAPPSPEVTWVQRLVSLRRMWTMLMLVGAVLGGIFFGVVTPTEAAALGAFVALLLGAIYFRKLKWPDVRRATIGAVRTTGMLGFIMVSAMIFGRGLLLTGFTTQMVDIIKGLPVPPIVIIIAMCFLLQILGCFMDGAAINLIMTPLLAPIVAGLGFDLIWFGIVSCVNIEMGQLTPPVGMNLFVISGIADAPIHEVVRGALPFLAVQVLMLALIIAFPAISLWLPSMMG